jgi:hypothetical protein
LGDAKRFADFDWHSYKQEKHICSQTIRTVKDKHKNTLLHIACGFGRLKSVQLLYSVCPELIDELDDKHHNPVDVAIKVSQIKKL